MDLLRQILVYTPIWNIKCVRVEAQVDMETLENAIISNLDLITSLSDQGCLPQLNVSFKSDELNYKVFELNQSTSFIERIDKLKSFYSALIFCFKLHSVNFIHEGYASYVKDTLRSHQVNYEDIDSVIEDVRLNTGEVKRWRQVLALLENLEHVEYISNIDHVKGDIISKSWSRANWMWDLYTKLKSMAFKFELINFTGTQNGFPKISLIPIAIPQHVKRLNLELDLRNGLLETFDLNEKVNVKECFLAQMNINIFVQEAQTEIKIVFPPMDNSIKRFTIKATMK